MRLIDHEDAVDEQSSREEYPRTPREGAWHVVTRPVVDIVDLVVSLPFHTLGHICGIATKGSTKQNLTLSDVNGLNIGKQGMMEIASHSHGNRDTDLLDCLFGIPRQKSSDGHGKELRGLWTLNTCLITRNGTAGESKFQCLPRNGVVAFQRDLAAPPAASK